MTAQYFPNVDEVLAIIMSELPQGVYAEDLANDPEMVDGDYPNRSYSSAELRAHAKLYEDLYVNLSNIDKDKFISSATADGLTRWEKDLFNSAQDSNRPIEIRRQSALAKYRASGGINYPSIRAVAAGVLDPLDFDILPYSGSWGGAWILDESSLGLNTWLSKIDPLYGYLLDNDLDYNAAGLTEQQMLDILEVAYTYEVRIYGHATPEQLATLELRLTESEPARSPHIIRNDQVRPIV